MAARAMQVAIPRMVWRQSPLLYKPRGNLVFQLHRRHIQFSADDRIPATTVPDRVVRFYDREKGLSRSMDKDAEEACRLAEVQLKLKDIEPKQWVSWERPKEGILRYKASDYVNFHASDTIEQKLTRKVEVCFCPPDLKLSEAAQSNLIKIVGKRYNPNARIVKMTSDAMPTQAENKLRLESMIAQLVYYAKLAAGETTGATASAGKSK